ncbi:DUF992 domain-containing protein [Tropicimonas sp. IMCC6043]|nr:DUF992 domain-containing protein [Tropicimonas sp. IMCC6043]
MTSVNQRQAPGDRAPVSDQTCRGVHHGPPRQLGSPNLDLLRTSSRKITQEQDMKYAALGLAAATALILSTSGAHARADIGVLTCKLTDVKNDIVYSREEFACEFKPNVGDTQTYYRRVQSARRQSVGHEGRDARLGRARSVGGPDQGELARWQIFRRNRGSLARRRRSGEHFRRQRGGHVHSPAAQCLGDPRGRRLTGGRGNRPALIYVREGPEGPSLTQTWKGPL